MTKKDYIKFAQMLKYYAKQPDQTPEVKAIVKEITVNIMTIFENDNPLFNGNRFLDAVYTK